MTLAPAVIGRVTDVQPHPESDTLDIVSIGIYTNVANRENDQPRYQIGDYALMLPENLILPEWLLKCLDLWDDGKNKGMLAGSKGNRTKARSIAGINSNVVLFKIAWENLNELFEDFPDHSIEHIRVGLVGMEFASVYVRVSKTGADRFTPEGMDLGYMIGATVYVPVS